MRNMYITSSESRLQTTHIWSDNKFNYRFR